MEPVEKVIKATITSIRRTFYIYANGFTSDGGSTSFKVRYGPQDEKFYLDWVEGSYESSLQLLIHKTMYYEGIYKMFLNDRCLADVEEVIQDYPDSIYGPDEEDFTEDEEANGYTYSLIQYDYLDVIYYQVIKFVAEQLVKGGHDVGTTYADWGIGGNDEDDE